MRLLSLFLLLRRSPAEVIAVTEVIGYRRSPPCKWRRLGNLARSPLTPLFLPMVKLAILLDPSRSLYSSASTGPRSHHQYHPVASKMLKWSSSASSRSKSWFPQDALQRLQIQFGLRGLDLTTPPTMVRKQ